MVTKSCYRVSLVAAMGCVATDVFMLNEDL